VNDGGMRRKYTRAERDELIQGVTRRGESVRSAATRIGVNVSTAYNWVRSAAPSSGERARAMVGAPEATFARLVPARTQDARLVVRVSEIEIEVHHGFDAELLRSVVEALRGGAA